MILELNGLPGCGKTTIKQETIAKFNDIRHVGVAEFRGEQLSGLRKKLLKVSRFLMKYFPRNFRFYLKIKRLFSVTPRNEMEIVNHYEDMITIMYTVYLFHAYRKNKGAMLLTDEGIIQVFTSICAARNVNPIDLEAVMQEINSLHESVLFIHCNCSIEEAYRRIRIRNRNDSAIDMLKGEQLIAYLNNYEKQLTQIRERFCSENYSLNIDAYQSVDNQINLIMERIKKLG